jgi:RHS repeat-associated protein
MTSGSWSDVGGFKQTDAFDARLMVGFFGDAVTLTMGMGPDHSLYDVYIDGSLWQSFNGYAAADGQVDILIPGQPQLAGDGPHLLEIRNRPERQTAGTTYRLRFKQLVVHDRSATLRTIQYTYDGLARLREARYVPGLRTSAPDADLLRREQFTFDRAGNRTQQSIALNGGAPTLTNYTYNAANQMISAGGATLTYDNNGNLLNDGTNEYTWDRANRLTFQNLVSAFGGTSQQYDGLGNRVWQSSSNGIQTTITRYLLDLQPGLALVLAATTGATTDRYLHAARGSHAQQLHSGAWQHTLHDGLGSVRSVVDNSVAVLNPVSYSAYGTPDAAVGSPFAFTGEMRDGSGLQYHRARYYSPSLGVWISEDPLETPNRYGYVGGNVVNKNDPTGMFDWNTFTVEQGDSLSCIAFEGGVRITTYAEFEEQVKALSQYSPQPITDPNYIQIGQRIIVPDNVSSGDTQVNNIIATGRSGVYKSPCGLSRQTQMAPYVPNVSLPQVTPPAQDFCPVVPTPMPGGTSTGPLVLTGGFRGVATVAFNLGYASIGLDLAFEWRCTPYFQQCGWFANFTVSCGGELETRYARFTPTVALGAGMQIGLEQWPTEEGQVNVSQGASVTLPWSRANLQTGLSWDQENSGFVWDVGATSGSPSVTFASSGVSVYLGPNLEIPQDTEYILNAIAYSVGFCQR